MLDGVLLLFSLLSLREALLLRLSSKRALGIWSPFGRSVNSLRSASLLLPGLSLLCCDSLGRDLIQFSDNELFVLLQLLLFKACQIQDVFLTAQVSHL